MWRKKKKVCPFFLLENSRPLSPWGPLDSLSTYLGTDSLTPICVSSCLLSSFVTLQVLTVEVKFFRVFSLAYNSFFYPIQQQETCLCSTYQILCSIRVKNGRKVGYWCRNFRMNSKTGKQMGIIWMTILIPKVKYIKWNNFFGHCSNSKHSDTAHMTFRLGIKCQTQPFICI